MTTIFVVTEGQCSDYRICGVYSTRENAERAKVVWTDRWSRPDIEEYELDKYLADLAGGRRPYMVIMDRDGDCEREPIPHEPGEFRITHWPEVNIIDTMTVTVWATSPEHAAKIANERRVQLIADGTWPE